MGLLDDAIKEHLELKRRRGADPNEVERLEREALGPVRRSPQASEGAVFEEDGVLSEAAPGVLDEAAGAHSDEEPVLYDDLADEGPAEPPELADEPAFAGEREHQPFPEDDSEQGWSHEPAWETEEPLVTEEPEALAAEPTASPASPEPPPPAPAEPRSDHPGGETVEYDVEAEEIKGGEETKDGEAGKNGEDDPLEETPEFLQDTPDHDRLWFEQRPPKDFDFDK